MNKRIFLSPPHMGDEERKLLLDAFDSNWISSVGPYLNAFEEKFCEKNKVADSVALSSGTAGLHLALVALGIESGDEVFVSTLTFAATVNAICYLKAIPVFIDSDYKSWNMDPLLLEEELEKRAKLNKLPKAVLVVDLYGQSADMDPILNSCNKWNIPVIEDAAEALGATYKNKCAGTSGLLNVFSFNGNKIITTSGGGMVVSQNKELISKIRFLSTQAKDPAPWYQHSTIGYNYRLSNLLAAVGLGQLNVLDERVNARRNNFEFYYQNLKSIDGINFMPEADFGKSTRWLSCITIDNKKTGFSSEDVRLALEKENIESRPVWKPMHLQPVFDSYQIIGGNVSEHLFETGLCLPSGSSLCVSDLERVVSIFKTINK